MAAPRGRRVGSTQFVGLAQFLQYTTTSDNVEKLEASLTGTDECVVDIYELEEKHDDRITTLEEEVSGLKAENVEMRNHFNSMIKQLNDITAFVNEKHGHKIIEETFELDSDTPPNKGYIA